MPSSSNIRISIEFFSDDKPESKALIQRLKEFAGVMADVAVYTVGDPWFEFRTRNLRVQSFPSVYIDEKQVMCLKPESPDIDHIELRQAIAAAQEVRRMSVTRDMRDPLQHRPFRSLNYTPNQQLTEARHNHLSALSSGRQSRYSNTKVSSDCRKLGWTEYRYDQDVDPPRLLGEFITKAGTKLLERN